MAHSELRNQKSVYFFSTNDCDELKLSRNVILVRFKILNHTDFSFLSVLFVFTLMT